MVKKDDYLLEFASLSHNNGTAVLDLVSCSIQDFYDLVVCSDIEWPV